MNHAIRWPMKLVVLLIMGCLLVPAASAAGAPDGNKSGTEPATRLQAETTVVKDCAWATRQVRFAAIRVKKVNKRVKWGQLPAWKLKASIRIYKRYLRIKNEKCSAGPPAAGPRRRWL
jgi:hypothetical protein